MTTIDLQATLASLASRRSVFHSEADLQHELAMEIRHLFPRSHVRLEVPLGSARRELDILVLLDETRIGIELKHHKASLQAEVNGERFEFSGGDPADVTRYGVWQDVRRIEEWRKAGALNEGFSLLLTNHVPLWASPRDDRQTNHDSFRLHESARVSGCLDWRSPPINAPAWPRLVLDDAYACIWNDYSAVNAAQGNVFRYLLLHVCAKGRNPG